MNPEDPDYWTKSQQLLAQRQAPQAQQPQQSSWGEANELLTRMQAQNPTPKRAPIAEEKRPESETFGPTFWAMALNLLGGGRDVGKILQAGVESDNRRMDAYDARNSPDAKLDREFKQAQLSKLDKENSGVNFGQAAQLAGILGNERSQGEQTRQFNTREENNLLAQQAKGFQERAQFEGQQKGMNDRTAAEIAARAKEGTLNRTDGNADAERNFKYQKQLQDERILAEADQNKAKIEATKEAKLQELQGKIVAPLPGTKLTNPERWQTMSQHDRTLATAASNDSRKMNSQFNKLQELMVADPTTANANTYRAELDALIGSLSKPNAQGVLAPTEYARTLQRLSDYVSVNSPYGKFQQMNGPRATWEVFSGQNPALQTMKQIQAGFRDWAEIQNDLNGYSDAGSLISFNPDKPQPTTQPTAAADPKASPQQPDTFDPSSMGGSWAGADGQPIPKRQVQAEQLGDPMEAFAPRNMTPTAGAAMPQQRPNTQPQIPSGTNMQGNQQLPPLIGPNGQMVQPMSIPEMQKLLQQPGWRVSNGRG